MREINVHELADEAKFNRFHAKVLAWCFVVIIIDGYDLAVAGAALPAIMKEMGVEAATAGFMASSALFGMMFGAIFLGALSDKIGRRWTISLCVSLQRIHRGSGADQRSCHLQHRALHRGLGIGGVMPNITAQMTEYAPKRIRSFLTTVMFSGYAIGGILAAVLGKQFIAQFGWQIVFFAAGVPVLLIPFILKSMPESLSFLVSRRDSAQLRQIAQSIDPGLKIGANDTFHPPRATNAGAGATVAQLFQDGRGLSTVMFWVAFFTGLFMIYALSTWLTKLMAMSGYSLGSALSLSSHSMWVR
ncbi:MFS transporter [Ottowia beijingensis]|uniref:MFS transporter n=1 Tax=Ottowia beijingensis TaxID=1207057 RepID=UPI00214DAC9C|nr:MFS transporter [Ottowia beijingensis]